VAVRKNQGKWTVIKEETKVDSKNRISLGVVSASNRFRVLRNDTGQYILDPIVLAPESEQWLHKNKRVLASVKKGLKQSAQGRTVRLGSFAKFAK
jgi:hypothetical protein